MTKAELIARVTAYVASQFNGDYGAAFRFYATDGGDRVGLTGLVKLLADAGVNTDWTREIWARAIMRALDTNEDGRISEAEFRHAVGWEGCDDHSRGKIGQEPRKTSEEDEDRSGVSA